MRKFAASELLGICFQGNWKKISNIVTSSYFMNNATAISLEEVLDSVAESYKISRDPKDYLLIPARANSIGRFNANLDGWTYPETISFRPEFGCRTYATYNNKPHFVEHQSSNYTVARGVILDSHLNLDNDASDDVKREVERTIGMVPDKDAFIEVIVAVDHTKDPMLANAYKTGSITTFSMGADVASTTCSICGNVSNNVWQFCDHIKNKYSGREYKIDGISRVAGELCNETVFQELSVVSDPADKLAVIQEGLLSPVIKAVSVESVKDLAKLSEKEVKEILSFTAKFAKDIPNTLAKIITSYLARS